MSHHDLGDILNMMADFYKIFNVVQNHVTRNTRQNAYH